MGLTPGTTVKLVKMAPFGDPMELQLRGYELSLRREDAAQIQVRAAAVANPAPETVSESAYHLGAACHGDCARCAMRGGAGCSHPGDLEAMHRAHRHEQEHHPSAYDPRAHDQRPWTVALVGNPNCGKTTTPSWAESLPQSIWSPFFSTSSMKFTASATGRSSSNSCMVR